MNLRIVDLHHHLLSGRLTSQQLVEFCLQRIRDTKKLNGFINVCEDTALEAARQSADRYKKGIFPVQSSLLMLPSLSRVSHTFQGLLLAF